jgi:membrane protease YdiL (CAAX protease family)
MLKSWLRVLLALVVNVGIMSGVLLPIKGYVSTPGAPAPWWGWAIALSLYPLFALQALLFHRFVDGRPLREFRLRWDGRARRVALWGALISAGMLLAFIALTQLTGLAAWRWNGGLDPTWTVMTALLLLQAGLGEEFFWRGYVLETQAPLGPVGSALVGTLLFTLAHLMTGRVQPLELCAIFVHGLFYVWLVRRSGSLWPAVIIHGVYDGLTSLLWANGRFTSLLLFDGDILWLKWVWKALILVPLVLVVWSVYGKGEGESVKRVA